MLLSALIIINDFRALVPAAFLTFSWIPFATLAVGYSSAKSLVPRKIYLSVDNLLYSLYLRTCLFIFGTVSAVTVSLHGDIEALSRSRESAIILCNHQSDTDWIIICGLASRQQEGEHMIRMMTKDVMKYLPMFGWYIFMRGFVYVRRFGNFLVKPVADQLAYLRKLGEPYWLVIFPEGTRFSARKLAAIAESKRFCEDYGVEAFKSVLFPRTKGCCLALDLLRPSLDAVYDVTIAYGQSREEDCKRCAPNMFEFVCGRNPYRYLQVHVKRFSVSEIPSDNHKLRKWLISRYQTKDK
ncbi:hypothetical protein AB6A40_009274 [Gnathostoma spinigerum]|uniref:Phospholipid/glycerol acyltransferase domain-containing protein n=1 Tax=Gnathostoma spinigerum TaxID=75299 RepID=A0ABD6ERH7_9BILA